MPDNANSWQTN